MNRESPQALLHLPIPERSGLSFCQASPWALERWIAELPKANPAAFAQRLHLGLLELIQLRTPAENRLQLLELFRAEIHFLGEHLEFYFLQPGRVLDERAHEVASLCQTLQRQLAIGYEQLIALEEPGPPEQPDSRLLSAMAIQRALYALNATLIRAKQLHSLPPAGLWLKMHSLYRIARAWDLQRLSIHDQPSGQASPTIERTYLASLMLGVARCNQMSRTDIAGLARALKSWSGLVCLREEVEACPLLVDLGRDSPPRYRRLCEPGTAHDRLGIDPGVLLGVLEACLQQEKDARHSLPALPGGIGVELLEHLRSAWGDLVHRVCLRAPGDGRLGAIFGMNAVHYHLAGWRPFAEVLRRP